MKPQHFPIIKDGPQIVQRIECSACGAVDKNSLNNGAASDETLTSYFRRRGWEVDPKRKLDVCPECVAKRTKQQRDLKAEKKMQPSERLTVVEPSPNSALAKKIMSDLLFENYDLQAKDYKSGWSDERIAKESGLSVTFVSQRRAQDYGPVSPPKKAIAMQMQGLCNAAILAGRESVEKCNAARITIERALGELERLSGLIASDVEKLKKEEVAS